jgi:hypothetical protein
MWMILVAVMLQAQAPAADEYRAIWRAALEDLGASRPGRTLVLFDTTAGACGTPAVHPCFTLRDPVLAGRDIPAADLLRVRGALEHEPVAITGLNMAQVRSMSRSEFRTLTAAGTGDFWTGFYSRYPGSAGWVLLSAPSIGRTGDTAWLFMDHVYGNLGAEGWLLSLERRGNRWEVARKWLLWQS